jgi:hypothetical protein
MKTHKYYAMLLTVEVSGTFPYDMLRYDNCVPATETDSGKMGRRDLRQVTLRRFCSTKTPASPRWASFGATIIREVPA